MRVGRRPARTRITVEAFGVQLELYFTEPRLKGLIETVLPPGMTPCEPREGSYVFGLGQSGSDSYEVTVGGTLVLESATESVALDLLGSHIRNTLAMHARTSVFLRAGTVIAGNRAVLLPGGGLTGKTSLVAALVRAGATLYSDEHAVLDQQGRVQPHPWGVPARSPRGRARRVSQNPPAIAEETHEVGLIVFTRYRPNAAWQPRRLSPGEGVLALLPHALSTLTRPTESMRACVRACAGAVILQSERGDADALAQSLLATLVEQTPD